MQNKELIKQTLAYLQLSTMSPKEKSMWTLMVPSMNEDELRKLNTSLQKEIDALMDLQQKASK